MPLDAVGFDRDSVDGEEADMQLPHTQEPEQHVISWLASDDFRRA